MSSVIINKFIEIIIYFIIIFCPFAFGTTENWSMLVVNTACYLLGILFIVDKFLINIHRNRNLNLGKKERILNVILPALLLLLLLYIFISANNFRAYYDLDTKLYYYNENYVKWLPHSYNSKATWDIFYQYLGLFSLFWATCHWIFVRKNKKDDTRIMRILNVIVITGAFLAVESLFQRIYYDDGRGKLLFLIQPKINSANLSQLGPFAYRSNGATYLNIIWPIAIGLYAMYNDNKVIHKTKMGNNFKIMYIPIIILIISASLNSLSRGAIITLIIQLVILMFIIVFYFKRKLIFTYAIMICISLIVFYINTWDYTEHRLSEMLIDNFSGRIQIYETILKITNDYSIFGSGPGTFETIIQFEINETMNAWHSWAHCDYLEYYLTFGLIGCINIGLIILIYLIIIFRRLANKSFLFFCIIIGFIGTFIHAIVDFPLQTYTILTLLIILSAIIMPPKKHLI